MSDRFWMWLAWRLPRKLGYWATIKSCAEATQGKWSDTIVPELSMMDMLKRVEP